MTARLPSLNGLRAFEAAARHLSFTQAASELNVTQTAISHQIKRLEEELGVRLFIRQNRSLTLTAEAQDYLPGIRAAFIGLAQRLGSEHEAHHQMMECLGEMIWNSQRSGLPPDGVTYIECVKRR